MTPDDVERSGCRVQANQVVSLSAGSIAGRYDGIRSVARALGRPKAADELIAHMQAEMDAVNVAVRDEPKPTVVLLEWTDPIFASGNWAPELIELAGGRPLLSEKGHSTAITWECVVQADPDYLVVAPCGFDLERTVREIPVLERFTLTAVKYGRTVLADGNQYFNRSGTTIVETVQLLAEILYGKQFEPRWRGTAWRTYRVAAGEEQRVRVRR